MAGGADLDACMLDGLQGSAGLVGSSQKHGTQGAAQCERVLHKSDQLLQQATCVLSGLVRTPSVYSHDSRI